MHLINTSLLQTGIFINNQWQPAASGNTFEVSNPADQSIITNVANGGIEDVNNAIEAAANAFTNWSREPAKTRSVLLRKWFDLIIKNGDDLAVLLTSEQGKPFAEAKGEVQYGASFIEWFSEEARRTYGDTIPSPDNSKQIITIKQAIGVVAAITPWNFPIAMITRKIAPALAAGCTVVLKPAEDTPLCALALAQLAKEAGFPGGVLNVIPTMQAAEAGKVLTTHPSVAKVSFTGSTEVGRILMQQSASTVKKMSLELGGNAPVIVFEDADIDVAVKGALATKYRNAGQTCVCANRLMIQRNIYSSFIEKYKTAVKELRVGNGLEDGVQIGPLINEAAVEKVNRLVKDALDKGAKIICGGEQPAEGNLFYQPSIITNCTMDMDISREEIFGPVSVIYLFNTEEEAIALANDTEFGLAAYFFTQNISKALRVAGQLEYGMVGINEGLISYAEAPFGGVKQSGFGREGSRYGTDEYLSIKYLCIGNL